MNNNYWEQPYRSRNRRRRRPSTNLGRCDVALGKYPHIKTSTRFFFSSLDSAPPIRMFWMEHYGSNTFIVDFFNWHRVKVLYCDGASFAANGDNELLPLHREKSKENIAPIWTLIRHGRLGRALRCERRVQFPPTLNNRDPILNSTDPIPILISVCQYVRITLNSRFVSPSADKLRDNDVKLAQNLKESNLLDERETDKLGETFYLLPIVDKPGHDARGKS
ncbi:pectinacetylesterase family protein [Striga asiatica]|uniref:Pectinacetylesterase family protein n=1 Tax=Striga asiatica TaxID=4170 RepID=A0A5A7QPJ8_STRAF|nr:pectinacetylesterase family protein [Striga asiatica]